MYDPKSKLEVMLALSKCYTADGAYREVQRMKENLSLFFDILETNNIERNAQTLHSKSIANNETINPVERERARSIILDCKTKAAYEQKLLEKAVIEAKVLAEAEKKILPKCSYANDPSSDFIVDLFEYLSSLMLKARTEFCMYGKVEPDTAIELSSIPLDNVLPKFLSLLNDEEFVDPLASRDLILKKVLPEKIQPVEMKYVASIQ